MKINKDLHPGEAKKIIGSIKAAASQESDSWRDQILVEKVMGSIEETKKKKSTRVFLRGRLLTYASLLMLILAGMLFFRGNNTTRQNGIIAGKDLFSKEFCMIMENMDGLSRYSEIREMEILLSAVD